MREEFDVVVIGSGAGGAPIAEHLVEAGFDVLVLEKGPLFRPQTAERLSDFKRDELFATGPEKRIEIDGVANRGGGYHSSHVEPDLNDEPHVYLQRDGRDHATIEGYTAQCVGGGTQLYGAVSLRFSELDFRLRTFNEGRTLRDDPNGDVKREARDWPLAYDDLEPYYCHAEERIGMNGWSQHQRKPFSRDTYQDPLPPNPISGFAETGMQHLGAELGAELGVPAALPYRTPLAVITRDHPPSGRRAGDPRTSYVNRYGDPLGLKSSTWVALLAPLEGRANFRLLPNCVVTHLTCQGARVEAVHFRDPAGAWRTVRGRVVVVACSAIESVRLLQLSSREDHSGEFGRRIDANGLLGRYFLTHCFGGAETVVPGRFDKSRSLDSDWAIDCCAIEAFLDAHGLWAGGAIYNNTSDQALPLSLARTHGSQDLDTIWKGFVEDRGLVGDALVAFLDGNFGRRLSVSFMANQVPLPSNRIELHPTVRDKWNRPVAYILKDWHRHDVHLMNVFAEHCARVLRYGCDPVNHAYPVEGFGHVQMAENARARIANHVLGGARFGNDPADSVLDRDCRAWSFDNLYVTDGSFMPTSGGANPTLTIEANAFRVADALKSRL